MATITHVRDDIFAFEGRTKGVACVHEDGSYDVLLGDEDFRLALAGTDPERLAELCRHARKDNGVRHEGLGPRKGR